MGKFFLWGQIICVAIFSFPHSITAAEKGGGGPPPAKVVITEVSTGVIAPQAEFSGTVYYKEVSSVACEVRGRVDAVKFEEGTRVKKGELLIKLNSEVLEKSLEAATASLSQAGNDLRKARNDLKRIENLYKENSIAQQTYDDHVFNVKGLESRVASLAAEAGRLNIQVSKTRIVA